MPMHLLRLFRLRRDEYWPAFVVALLSAALNVLFVLRLNPFFRQPGLGPYKNAIQHGFQLAGYDPYTYWGLSEWDYYYDVVRHPLLNWMAWPMAMLNSGLSRLLGVNCVQFIVAVLLTCCSVYSFLFLFRILREAVGVGRGDALLLSAFFFSMAYILLSVIVPDHFTPSMMLLMCTLYVACHAVTTGRQLTPWQWTLLFLITAGVTLSNGPKVLLALLFVSGALHVRSLHGWWPALRPYMVPLALSLVLLLGVAVWQRTNVVIPREESQKALRQRQAEQEEQRILSLPVEQQKVERNRQARRQRVLRLQAEKSGQPVSEKGLLRWTDVTTSRWKSLYENMFGESILFHQKHFLEDTLVQRPVFVPYVHRWAYGIEVVIVLLFLLGIWMGRRQWLLWLALGMFACDLFLHLVLGFGLNEIHIMAPHWLFVVPVALAFAFAHSRGPWLWLLRVAVAFLAMLLFVCNSYQLVTFLLTPVPVVL